MAEKSVKAVAREVRLAPRKVSLVASLVRGRSVDDALVILEHTPKRAAKSVAKTIASAKANAVNTHGVKAQDLIIERISVTAGTRLKRFRPAAHGRALPFQRKTSNIEVVVSGTVKEKKSAAAKAETTVTEKKESK